jgi:hypothetical protein
MSQSFMATSSGERSAITLMVEADTTRHFHRDCGGQTTEMVRDSEIHEFTL